MLNNFDTAEFLKTTWQQQCAVYRQVLNNTEDLIEGDELAALACETAVESRFVFANTNETDWRVEHGPFPEERFDSLPNSHYTLMVQSVDQWSQELHELLAKFTFLPAWRRDDILATWACDKGGVGPHFDYYDVFLIQAQGQRRWRIGQRCDANTALRANNDIKLLQDFEQSAEYVLEAGDMLYIPAGVAHWGSAIGHDCTTLSVGFRAPARHELREELELANTDTSEDIRYTDTLAAIDADQYRINDAAIAQALKLAGDDADKAAVQIAFGELLTEPRNIHIIEAEPLDIEPDDLKAVLAMNPDGLNFELDAACRCAYSDNGSEAWLFLNGSSNKVSADFAKNFCHSLLPQSPQPNELELAYHCLQSGFIYLDESQLSSF